MMAEPRSVPSVTVGTWKSGSKEKRDRPYLLLCCQNRFHLLELSKKSVEKLEIYLCRLLAFLNGDWVCPGAWLGWTLSWFRFKKIDALSHTLTLSFGNTRPCPQHSTLFCLMWGTQCIPGLVCHGGCWQISSGESHAWLISLPISWKFSPSPHQVSSPPQGKRASSFGEDSGSLAHPFTSSEHKFSS